MFTSDRRKERDRGGVEGDECPEPASGDTRQRWDRWALGVSAQPVERRFRESGRRMKKGPEDGWQQGRRRRLDLGLLLSGSVLTESVCFYSARRFGAQTVVFGHEQS